MSINFLIVGSMRSGTSTLTCLLNRHRDISLPERELYYFSFPGVYARGEDWYEKRVASLTSRRRVIGEKCVSYGYLPEARDRIWRYSPEVRLIWILRHPVERAYSHYIHNVNNGLERRPFAVAIREERTGATTAKFRSYIHRSRYVLEIRRFLSRFPRRQLCVLTLEELVGAPRATLRSVFDFLGVSVSGYRYRPVALNQRYRAAFPGLVGWCVGRFGYFSVAHRAARLFRLPVHPGKLDRAVALDLHYLFEDDNRELRDMVGVDTGQWRPPIVAV